MNNSIDFEKEVETQLKKENKDSHTHIDTKTFRASSVGYCERQIIASKLGIKNPDIQSLGRFKVGNDLHEWIQTKILPKFMTTHEKEVIIDLPTRDIEIIGHYDCFDGQIVYDFKTRSSWYKFNPPIQRHIDQLTVYMMALGVEKGKMVYLNKSDLTVKQYTYEYDHERFKEIIDKVERVKSTLEDKGFPKSAKELNSMYEKCGSCVGCRFEDTEKLDFKHLKKEY